MKKNFDFYADAKKNWNNGEGLPDACDVLRDDTNDIANTLLTLVAKKMKMTEDELFNCWKTDMKSDDLSVMEAFKSLGLPEGTTVIDALGHPVWQYMVFFYLGSKVAQDED